MKRILFVLLSIACMCANAATLVPVPLLNPAGSTAGQASVSTGPTTPPTWGNVAATSLAAQAANTVVANVTGASASPTAVALPSCSTANSALKYTSGSGLSCGSAFALTSGNLSQFASTTSGQLQGVISDGTGSGALVFGTSPTIATPTITGITNGSTAAAGSVGENATATGSGVALSNNTQTTIASTSLTAGNWMVGGECTFIPAGTTTVQAMSAGVSTTTNSLPAVPLSTQLQASFITGAVQSFAVPMQFFNPTSTTTVFMVAFSTFSVSTMNVTCSIWKLRIH